MLKWSDRRVLREVMAMKRSNERITQKAIAARTVYTRRTVNSAVKRLCKLGYLHVDKSHRPQIYTVLKEEERVG